MEQGQHLCLLVEETENLVINNSRMDAIVCAKAKKLWSIYPEQ